MSGALRFLLDQFFFSPIFIGVFLSTLIMLEGRPSEVVSKLQQECFSSVLSNWQSWIPFQFLNFPFVPRQFQFQYSEGCVIVVASALTLAIAYSSGYFALHLFCMCLAQVSGAAGVAA